jgi:hypothetical protein
MDVPNFSKSQHLNDQIHIWLNRAALAYKQGNQKLSKEALDKRWYFQKQLADLENSKPPEQPAEAKVFFRDWDSNRISEAATQAVIQGKKAWEAIRNNPE